MRVLARVHDLAQKSILHVSLRFFPSVHRQGKAKCVKIVVLSTALKPVCSTRSRPDALLKRPLHPSPLAPYTTRTLTVRPRTEKNTRLEKTRAYVERREEQRSLCAEAGVGVSKRWQGKEGGRPSHWEGRSWGSKGCLGYESGWT